jgi:hypothetical protein
MSYPPGTGPGKWTSCGKCGESIPCDTAGNPYPHTCRK